MVVDVVNIQVGTCGSCAKPLYGPVRFCPFCGQRAVAGSAPAPAEAPSPSSMTMERGETEQKHKSTGSIASGEAGENGGDDGPLPPPPPPHGKRGLGKFVLLAALLGAGLWLGWSKVKTLPKPPEEPKSISGEIGVVDTETVTIDGRSVKLAWVSGDVPSEAIQPFQDYILTHPGKATCEPVGNRWRCTLGRQNLSEVLLMSGLSCPRPGAPESLRAAANLARNQRKGVWSLPNPCSSQ